MRRRASWIVVFLGLSACVVAARPPAQPAPHLKQAPSAPRPLASEPPAPAPDASSVESADDDRPPCSDPVEAAYLSDCQTEAQPGTLDAADPEELDDDVEEPLSAPPPPKKQRPVHPFAQLSDADLEKMYKDDPASVGPMSVGATNAGGLINGIQMPRSDHWVLIDPANAWGTKETIDALTSAIDKVYEKYPDSPPMQIGHISARRGGPLSPHVSHQAGRDVDVSYYLTTPSRWFERATDASLDRARTWTFVRALLTDTDVEMILIDRSIQKLLRDYALSIGESPTWLGEVFDGRPGVRAVIHHAKGHATHIHVRFFNPIAQETARRLHPAIAKRGALPVAQSYILHRARSGDTLGSLARRYGTTVEAIQAANGLRSTAIKSRRVYKIPRPAKQSPPAPPTPRRHAPSRNPGSHR